MNQPRVFFLNRFYWPDENATAQLLHDLSTALAERNIPVTVISSRPAGSVVTRVGTSRGVTIWRIRSTDWGRRSLIGRVVDFLSYYVGALWRLFVLARRGDIVVAMSDPPLLGLFVWPVAALRRAERINWVQDIYPEVAIALTKHSWLGALLPLRNRALRSAIACVVPGEAMKRTLVLQAVSPDRIIVSPNWGPSGVTIAPDAKVSALRQEWDLAGKFVVMYSGNLGRVHDLDPLIEVAEFLREERDIVLLFVGRGARRMSLERAVRARQLPNVWFREPQPRNRLSESLGVGHLHLVTLLEGAERWVFPSKLYGITSAGRSVFFIGNPDGEIAQLIRQHNIGDAFSGKTASAIATAIVALRDDPARIAALQAAALKFSHTHFDDAVAMWAGLLSAKLAVVPPTRAYLPLK